MNAKIHFYILVFISISVAFYGCSDLLTSPDENNNLTIGHALSKDTPNNPENIIKLDTVKILFKDFKIISGLGDSQCFDTGVFVIHFKPNNTVNRFLSKQINPGSYNRLMFEIHKAKPGENVSDPDFWNLMGNSYSVVVKGLFNQKRFVYKSSETANLTLYFAELITLEKSARLNVTFLIKPYIWFLRNNEYMDPGDPANADEIDNNIKNNTGGNFSVFMDNDKNGIPDN
jgi:hypothetical protein